MAGADPLAGMRLAAVGLEVTTGRPPQISEVSVLRIDGGVIVAGPLTWPVQPDVPACQVRPASRADRWLAPPWGEIAERVTAELTDRVLVVHDLGRWAVLRAHLPDWQPPAVVFTQRLAQTIWPGLDGYDLPPLTQQTGITPAPDTCGDASAEAHTVALLLLALTRAGAQLLTDEEASTNGG